MRIRLKAPAGLSTTGIYGADGKEAPVGTEVTVNEAPVGWEGRYDVLGDDDKPVELKPADGQPINKASDSTDGETPFQGAEKAPQDQMDGKTATPSAPAVTGSYAIKDNGNGWFVITKDGEEVTKSVRKGDVEGFDTMSDADKQALAELYKKD